MYPLVQASVVKEEPGGEAGRCLPCGAARLSLHRPGGLFLLDYDIGAMITIVARNICAHQPVT